MKRARRKPDPDAPELDAAAFARGMPLADAPASVRDSIRDFQRRHRGRGKQKTPTKALISLRLSREVLARYRATGRGWQTRIAADLTKAAKRLPGAAAPGGAKS